MRCELRTARDGTLAQEANHGLAALLEHFGRVHRGGLWKRFRSRRSAVGGAENLNEVAIEDECKGESKG